MPLSNRRQDINEKMRPEGRIFSLCSNAYIKGLKNDLVIDTALITPADDRTAVDGDLAILDREVHRKDLASFKVVMLRNNVRKIECLLRLSGRDLYRNIRAGARYGIRPSHPSARMSPYAMTSCL